MTGPQVVVLPDEAALGREAAERIAATLVRAVEERGRADWATTGGSMAPAIYRRLAAEPLRDRIPWASVHVWWGDDRYVPRDHPLSNVKPFDDILLAIAWTQGGQLALGQSGQALPVALPLDNLHPFPTTAAIGEARGAAWCADTLAAELEAAGLERSGDWPVFDLVLLGIGPDGHLLSVFPGSPAIDARELAMAIPAPGHVEPHVERVTLNPGILSVARSILVVAAGAAKAATVNEALRGDRDARQVPARLARTDRAVWLVDASAGSQLDRHDGAMPSGGRGGRR
jgi:6-phosphogluconolactonase